MQAVEVFPDPGRFGLGEVAKSTVTFLSTSRKGLPKDFSAPNDPLFRVDFQN